MDLTFSQFLDANKGFVNDKGDVITAFVWWHIYRRKFKILANQKVSEYLQLEYALSSLLRIDLIRN